MANMSHNKTNLAFKANGANIESVAAPYIAQAFTTPTSTAATNASSKEPVEPFNINDYYTIPESEVWSKVFQVKQMIRDTDLSNMTDVEAYDFVEKQFIEAFGENFLLAQILGMTSSKSMYAVIGFSFGQMLHHIFGPEGRDVSVGTVNRERLYGDASLDEIHDSIRASYPDTLTHLDILLMHYEMKSVGLFDSEDTWDLTPGRSGYGARNCLAGAISSLAHGNPNKPWEIMLHMPVDLSKLFGWYNMWQWQGNLDASTSLKEFMTKTLSGQFDEKGWLIGGVMPWDWDDGNPDGNQMLELFAGFNSKQIGRNHDLLDILFKSLDKQNAQQSGFNQLIRREVHREDSIKEMKSMFTEEAFKQWFKGMPAPDYETPANTPGGGIVNTSVFEAESSTEDNPAFVVKGTYSDGTPFEGEVNIYSIDPRNASFIEMLALDGYFLSNEQMIETTWIAAQAMREIGGLSGPEHDAFTKYDFVHYLQQMKERHHLNDNKDAYTMYENVINSLLDFIARRES